jgi:hypothetical protein
MIEDAKTKEQYLAFTHGIEHQDKSISIFYKNFTKRRKDKRLDVRLLTNSRFKELFKRIYAPEEFKRTKLRFTSFNFPQGLTIFRDNLILITWKDTPTAIKIESSQIAKEFRNFFLQLWKISKKNI